MVSTGPRSIATIRPLLAVSLLTCLLVAFVGCSMPGDRAAISAPAIHGPAPWTGLDANRHAGDFRFAIVADRTGGQRDGVFPSAIEKLNLLQPEFVLCVGDLIEGYTEDREVLMKQWDEFDGLVRRLDMPFFYVNGNHDLTRPEQVPVWIERHGPTYYHFVYQGVLFICLQTWEPQKDAPARVGISDEEYDYVRKVLADHRDARWTFVFMHFPLWDMTDTGRWPDVEQALAERPHTIFAGHRHTYARYERDGAEAIILATTGGSSALKGEHYGQFDHLVWVTMKPTGPVIANLMLDGIRDDNIRDEAEVALMDRLLRAQMVYLSPVYVRPGASSTVPPRASLRVVNDTDMPMKFSAAFDSDSSLVPVPSSIETELAPGDEKEFTVDLSVEGTPTTDTFKRLVLKGTCSYTVEGEPDLVIDFTKRTGRFVAGADWTVEAEDMELSGYRAATHKTGRGVVFVRRSKGEGPWSGAAQAVFPGPDGKYRVRMVGVPEAGGTPAVKLTVGDTVLLDATLPAGDKASPWWEARTELVAGPVDVRHGEPIILGGTTDGPTGAAIDAVIFEPASGQE